MIQSIAVIAGTLEADPQRSLSAPKFTNLVREPTFGGSLAHPAPVPHCPARPAPVCSKSRTRACHRRGASGCVHAECRRSSRSRRRRSASACCSAACRDRPPRTRLSEFAAAWQRGDFAAMHELIAPEDRQRASLAAFRAAYERAGNHRDRDEVRHRRGSRRRRDRADTHGRRDADLRHRPRRRRAARQGRARRVGARARLPRPALGRPADAADRGAAARGDPGARRPRDRQRRRHGARAERASRGLDRRHRRSPDDARGARRPARARFPRRHAARPQRARARRREVRRRHARRPPAGR